MDNKIIVRAKDGKLLLGNHFIELEDQTWHIMKTSDLDSFKRFLALQGKFYLFYNSSSVKAMPKEVNRDGDPIAECSLNTAGPLEMLIQKIGRKMTAETLEEFLFAMSPFLRGDSVEMFGKVKHLIVQKVVKVEREKKQNGDFVFAISSKSEKDSFQPPENLSFEVPIFEHIEETHTFKIPFFFEFSSDDDGAALYFTLKSPMIREELESCRKAILEKNLEDVKVEKYWGHIEAIKKDDSWKYQNNGLKD